MKTRRRGGAFGINDTPKITSSTSLSDANAMLDKILKLKEGKEKYSVELNNFMKYVSLAKQRASSSPDDAPIKDALSAARNEIMGLSNKNPKLYESLFNYTIVFATNATANVRAMMKQASRGIEKSSVGLDRLMRNAAADKMEQQLKAVIKRPRGSGKRTRRNRRR